MQTIAWDVDDALNDLTRCWFEQEWIPSHADAGLRYADLRANPPHELVGCELYHYLESLDRFRLGEGFRNMRPVPAVLRWFERYGDGYRHIALTAVPLRCAAASAAWVIGHFGRWIRTYHFVPSARPGESLPAYDRDKKDLLAWLEKVDVLVDDHAGHVAAARTVGCAAVLMPRPWNGSAGTVDDALDALNRALSGASRDIRANAGVA